MSESSKQWDPNVWAPRAQKWRQERVQKFAKYLIQNEGQSLTVVMKEWSLQSGVAMRTVQEYWDVLSPDNRGPVYEKHGIIAVRGAFKRHLK